jgi:hypothetical protein
MLLTPLPSMSGFPFVSNKARQVSAVLELAAIIAVHQHDDILNAIALGRPLSAIRHRRGDLHPGQDIIIYQLLATADGCQWRSAN